MLLLMSESNTLRGLDGGALRRDPPTIPENHFRSSSKDTESIKLLFKVNERLVVDI